MTNEIIILNERTATWTETRKVEVTRWEEQEVECSKTYVDLRLPLADLQLLASIGEKTNSTTIDMRESGEKLARILRDMGLRPMRYRSFCKGERNEHVYHN